MTAAQDYPLGTLHGEVARWRAMCDEIDRLRANNTAYADLGTSQRTMIRHLDELIETLTTHADAMCALLVKVRDGDYNFGEPVSDDGPGTARWNDLNEAIHDYTDFIKEC